MKTLGIPVFLSYIAFVPVLYIDTANEPVRVE
jgi:hypothetical protein